MNTQTEMTDEQKRQDVRRTSLRLSVYFRDRLKGFVKEAGFPNQDDAIAFLIEKGIDALEADKDALLKEVRAFMLQNSISARVGGDKAKAVADRLANLDDDKLSALLAQLEDSE